MVCKARQPPRRECQATLTVGTSRHSLVRRTAIIPQRIVSWSHTGRVRSEAAFARLAGVAPIPAALGQTVRQRRSRGGDRQLNRALHTVILHRRVHDPATRDYIARRVAEGKTSRDAIRLLKR